ncbi:MAG: peptidase T [Deltaproteobacteria bacterium]|nr:peptidase T [Deltaproteobacteria bacterium]
MEFPDLLDRFISYVKIDTRSDPDSVTFPSTEKQLDLANKLAIELKELGLLNVAVNQYGYVSGYLGTNQQRKMPAIALIAHLDTSPDVSGTGVNPKIHRDFDGKDIILSLDSVLAVEDNPLLEEKIGKTIITTDGNTLLGADDKAGIAEIMSALNFLIKNPDYPRPDISVLFTPDEEVGKGTDKITYDEIGAEAGYTVDGGRLGELEDETFCADYVDIKIKGVNVHPGYAKGKMVNALKIAAEIINNLPQEAGAPENTDKREGYIHPHVLTGNVDEAKIQILVRDFKEQGLVERERMISDTVSRIKNIYSKAEIGMTVNESYRNMKQVLDKYPEVLEKAERAIEEAGLKLYRTSIRGGTDGARLSFMGLPTPNLFTGGNNFHSRFEWIALEDMQKAAEVIVRLMKIWTE